MTRRPTRPLTAACATAATISAAVFCAVAAYRHTIPFGPRSRGIDDLGNQHTPFLAELSRLLHGSGISDWQWNWYSGGGAPFLPEYATYLGSPAAAIAALFPRDHLDTAMFATIAARLAVAAAVMTLLLLRLRPRGRPWVAALLGAAYATCGWTFNDAEYEPMWLDGLAALPALTLAGWWARHHRHAALGAGLVALAWWANYYTALMASLGAAILTAALCLAAGDRPRETAVTLLRFAGRGLLGVSACAVILWPAADAILHSRQAPSHALKPAPLGDVAGRLLPLTEGVSLSPSYFVGTAVLLLAATLPFHCSVSAGARTALPAALVIVVASQQWPPTQLIWNDFDEPNGSPFRAAFVVCALLVMCAWYALADAPPPPRALAGGAAITLGMVAVAVLAPSRIHRDAASLWVAAAVGLATAVTLLAARTRTRDTRSVPRAAAVTAVIAVAVGGSVAERVATGMYIEDRREELIHAQPSWAELAPLITARDTFENDGRWPWHRVGGTLGVGDNRGALVGLPTLDYYSTVNSEALAGTFTRLGAPWVFFGRSVRAPDATLSALLGADLVFHYEPGGTAVQATRQVAFPLARALPSTANSTGGSDPFHVRNALTEPAIYDTPAVRMRHLPGAGPDAVEVTTRCAPGRHVEVIAPRFTGTWRFGDATGTMRVQQRAAPPDAASAGVSPLGPAPPNGQVRIELTPNAPQSSATPVTVGCLDTSSLHRQASQATADLAELDVHGSRVFARWVAPVAGDAVIATVAQRGWACTADGRDAPATARAGLMAVSMNGATTLECRYTTPGLRHGTVISAAALALIVAVAVRGRLRPPRRRAMPRRMP